MDNIRIIELVINIALVGVGCIALLVYILQERRKKIEAASLIIIQIDEIQDQMQEINSYISNGTINQTGFYESLPILDRNNWEQYKHLFVKRMSIDDYKTINDFFEYVSAIQEQQSEMKNIQKEGFMKIMNVCADIQKQFILSDLTNTLFQNGTYSNSTINDEFWRLYNFHQDKIQQIFSDTQHATLLPYSPVQIQMSLEKVLKKYAMLEVKGTDGYRLLKNISKKKW